MEPVDPPTIVIFRKWRDGEILALFPEIEHNGPLCTSYQHLGKHGGADYHGCIQRTMAADPEEYQPLLKELRQIGYDNLVVRKRYSPRRGRR